VGTVTDIMERQKMGRASRLVRNSGVRYVSIVALAGLLGFAALAISLSEPGGAAFPGTNGRIAFSNGQSYASQSIYSANADGSSPLGLTSGTGDYWPSYSADGSKIAFNRLNGIVVMGADGAAPTQIATGAKTDNTTIKWQSNYPDPRSSDIIPEVKIETRTRNGHGFYNPAFTPDGTQLAVAEESFNKTQENVCAVENSGDMECLDYSDSNSYFYYQYNCHECFEHIIMLSSTTGAVLSEVTPKSSDVFDFSPTVSADGKLAFVRYIGGSPASSGLFLIPSPGVAALHLTSGNENHAPDFSPDSSKLIFVHGQKEFGVIGSGGGPISLIALPAPPPGSSAYVSSPKFSPDGTQIAFNGSFYRPPSTEENGIFVMAANGAGPHRIAEGYDPSWQPIPIPPPAVPAGVKSAKGKVKLNKKNQAVIGTITCGSSPCTLKVLSALLKVKLPSAKGKANGKTSTASKKKQKAGSTYPVKVIVPKALAPGKKANVKVSVRSKALAALQKAGKGALTVKIKVTEGLGKKVVTMKSTLTPPPVSKKHSGKKKH
jgi:Tol biopolymer transport system component